MPKSSTCTPSGTGRARKRCADLDAEAVVTEEDVADAGHEDASRSCRRLRIAQRLDLVGVEEEVAALGERAPRSPGRRRR